MSNEVVELSLDSIIPDQNQPRKSFDETKLQELALSIEQHGLLHPILVRPIKNNKYQIVQGERRWRACKLFGLKTIKAEVRELGDKQVLEIQLVENLQREDLNPIEEAETFQRMISECGHTHKKISERIGKSREYVTKRLRLLNLSSTIQEKIRQGKLTASHAEVILSTEDTETLATAIIENELTVRQTKNLVKLNPEDDVLRRTSDVSENGLIIGVWISNESYSSLSQLASSKKMTIEKLCSKIIEKEVSKND